MLEKNIARLLSTNTRLTRDDLDLKLASRYLGRIKRDEIIEWKNTDLSSKALFLPNFMPRDPSYVEQLRSDLLGIRKESKINDYLGIHYDYHLQSFGLKLHDLLLSIGVSPGYSARRLVPGCMSLVSIGTGDGSCLKGLAEQLNPFHIDIIVSNWSELATSFGSLDWEDFTRQYTTDGKSIRVTRVHDKYELLSVCSRYSLLGLDSSFVFRSKAISKKLQSMSDILFSQSLGNLIHYLGYTVDEYNMMYNTMYSLASSAKVYQQPWSDLGKKALVCASGPSLDLNLDYIRQLQNTHIVIAGGSNFATLIRHGIRVDILALVEREKEVFTAYKELAQEYDIRDTYLFMSSTCNAELLSIFPKSIVFFRPALTPLSIFSESPRQILEFEGPEAVNTALAVAIKLGFDEIAFFGVDLGSRSSENNRSKDALDYSIRTWDQEYKANLGGSAFTNRWMIDVKTVIEAAIKSAELKTRFYNCSDGLLIDGAEPILASEYMAVKHSISDREISVSQITQWFSALPIYTKEKAQSMWINSNPRSSTKSLCSQLVHLFEGDCSFYPDLLRQLDTLLSLSKPKSQQFAIRMLRSTVYKTVLMVSQELEILRTSEFSGKIQEFGALSRQLLASSVRTAESEVYELCDMLEHLISN
jgi:hypothetical protein